MFLNCAYELLNNSKHFVITILFLAKKIKYIMLKAYLFFVYFEKFIKKLKKIYLVLRW